MRRDLFHSFSQDIRTVFDAYLKVVKASPFNKSPTVQDCSLITFNIGMSLKFNMNGGQVNIHFSVNGNKTDVQVRYSIFQLFGARYQAYDSLLTSLVEEELKKCPAPAKAEPVTTQSKRPNFCPNCGTALDSVCNFCPNCGQKIN